MIARHLLFGVVFACTGVCVTGAFAQSGGRPVTAKDFSGKNVCWNEGRRDVYGADGKFTSYSGHHTTWSVPDRASSSVATWNDKSSCCQMGGSMCITTAEVIEISGERCVTDPFFSRPPERVSPREMARALTAEASGGL